MCMHTFTGIEAYLQTIAPSTPISDLISDIAWLPTTLFLLLLNPAISLATLGHAVLLPLARILSSSLPHLARGGVRTLLQRQLQQLAVPHFLTVCRAVQKQITVIVEAGRFGAARLEVMMFGVLLDVLREASEASGGLVPYFTFNNPALSEAADLQAEYIAWMKHRETDALVSMCQLPFLLTPEAKSKILHGEAMMQKRQHMTQSAMQAFFQGQNAEEAGYLMLRIRRTHVVEDALNALVYGADDLKKPLRVTFYSGGVSEPAQDAGGVSKEFFQLLSRDLFRPEYGMFTYIEETRSYWINPASLEAVTEFALVGALLGLAIYNAVLLDVRFPLVLYKKLLGQTPSFQDLKEGFPQLGNGLQALLDYEPASDVESVFTLTFTAEYAFYGETRSVELKTGGAGIAVTGDNRKEYVDLYTQWYLVGAVQDQFAAFYRGFLKVRTFLCDNGGRLDVQCMSPGMHLDSQDLKK